MDGERERGEKREKKWNRRGKRCVKWRYGMRKGETEESKIKRERRKEGGCKQRRETKREERKERDRGKVKKADTHKNKRVNSDKNTASAKITRRQKEIIALI